MLCMYDCVCSVQPVVTLHNTAPKVHLAFIVTRLARAIIARHHSAVMFTQPKHGLP